MLPLPTPASQAVSPQYPIGGVPRKSQAPLIVAIVLIVVIVAGIGVSFAYVAYQNGQTRVLHAADQSDAMDAPNKLQDTCFSTRTDNSTLSYDYVNRRWLGYETLYETLGLSNPTRFAIDATWTLTLNYPLANLNLVSSATQFHIPAYGSARAALSFVITAAQLNGLPQNPNYSGATVTLDGTYVVTGTYSSYSVPVHTTTSGSTSSPNLPAC